MIDLAIVRAPHQLLYSIERLNNSKLRSVVVLDLDVRPIGIITNVLKYKKWGTIIKLNYGFNDAYGIFKYIFYLVILKILSFLRIKINNLVIGDGGSVFAKLISDNFKYIKNTTVIGDGADLIFRNESRKDIHYYCRIGLRTRKILRLLKLKFHDEYKYDEIFTYYRVGDHRLKPNDFSVLRGSIKCKSKFFDHNSIYFLGTILLDRFNEKEVEAIYKEVFGYCQTLEIKYIPHWREPLEQVEIARSVGATIVEKKEELAETFFMTNNIIPVNLGSFMSNACFSLAAIYPELKIKMFGVTFLGEEPPKTQTRLVGYLKNDFKDDHIEFNEIKVQHVTGLS